MRKLFAVILALAALTIGLAANAIEIERVDSVAYVKNADGSLGDKFQGWTKDPAGKYYYYKDGVRVTGVTVMDNGERYYFDRNGAYLNKRGPENGFNVIFENNYNVKLSEGKISFDILMEDMKGREYWEYGDDPFFKLYVFEKDKWVTVPYYDGDFPAYALMMDEDGIIGYAVEFFFFDFKFVPGLYRVKTELWTGEIDENGEYIMQTVRGEFNIVE
jgi:hypothetical protein